RAPAASPERPADRTSSFVHAWLPRCLGGFAAAVWATPRGYRASRGGYRAPHRPTAWFARVSAPLAPEPKPKPDPDPEPELDPERPLHVETALRARPKPTAK